MRVFTNRTEAGRALAERLAARDYRQPVVLALPRGGVPVAAEIADALDAPLDLVLVRKIGLPSQPELALGAVVDGKDGQLVVNEAVRRMAGIDDDELQRLEAQALAELADRQQRLLAGRERVPIAGATAILVDDGIATGATVRAALIALRRAHPARLVLAVPVAPPETIQALRREVDEVVCLETPVPFFAVGGCYRDFAQTSDSEVIELLERRAPRAAVPRASRPDGHHARHR